MKQEIDNNAMWTAFRQELALQGELHVIAAIDNALNNLGFTIKETGTIIPIPLKQGEEIIPLEQIILNVWELGNYWKELTKGFCNTEYGTQLDYIIKHWKEGEHYIKSLKKQGEQKPVVIPKFRVGDTIQNKYTHDKRVVTFINKDSYVTDDTGFIGLYEQDDWKLVEQKPVEWSEEDEKQVEDEIVRLSTLNLDKVKNDREISLWKHYFMSLSHEQKSEWKEEDETMLDCIINHFVKALDNTQSGSPLWDDFNEKIDWLKSLRPKNNDNWNDMSIKPVFPCDILYKHPNGNVFLFRYLEGGRGNDAQTTAFYCLDENGKWVYLKDVEPQNRWKPSDEQINTLEYYMHTLVCNEHKEILFGLYADLKKLREEQL